MDTTTTKSAELHDQLALEWQMVSAGAEDLERKIAAARVHGYESETPYGARLLKHGLLTTQAKLDEWLAENAAKVGRNNVAIGYLRMLDTYVSSYIGLKVVIDCLTGDHINLSGVCIKIGSRIQDEVRFRKFQEENPEVFKITERKIRESGRSDRNYMKTVLTLMANRVGSGVTLWPENHRFSIGKAVIDAIRSATGLVDYTLLTTGANRQEWIIQATETTLEWVEKATEHMIGLAPQYWPMVVEPKPWTNPWDGGYYTPTIDLSLVKTRNRAYLEELAEVDMPEVYNAVNKMQETPWRVNRFVLDVLRECQERRLPVAKLPRQDNIPEPVKPPSIVGTEDYYNGLKKAVREVRKALGDEAFNDPQRPLTPAEIAKKDWDEKHGDDLKAWKKKTAKTHAINRKLKSKRLQVVRILRMAEQFAEYEKIYFPYTYDFRGRAYPVPHFLNPQGNDVSKALLTFADGKPLTDENNGIFWLAVHGANTFGNDKCSLEEREGWALANRDRIRAVAHDPFGPEMEFWTHADKPWQFLAFCKEFTDALAHGHGFLSTLPVSVDGTCNGLQHYSAMLRDEVGGAAVNLVPSEKPSDIYAEVADVTLDKVTDLLCLDCSPARTVQDRVQSAALISLRHAVQAWQKQNPRKTGEPLLTYWERTRKGCPEKTTLDTEMARRWLEFGITRKITKRSVMTLPYSATQFSSRSFIEDAIREMIEEKGMENPFAFTEEWENEEGEPILIESDGLFEASMWLQALVWEAIGEVVKAAKEAMKFLAGCAQQVSKAGLPVNWRLPDGFFVEQRYFEIKHRRVSTVIDGALVRPALAEETDQIDKRAMSNGVAPNFVHSLDGCALRGFVNLAAYNGMRHFSLVHDSYGTVAADVELMQRCIRISFVELYQDHDPLALFLEDVLALVENPEKLPKLPEKGNLDLSLVEKSDFFFA